MILYLYGDNSFEINRQIGRIKQKYQSSTGSDGDMQDIDVADKGIGDLLGSLAVVPMFVTSRLIIVKNLAAAKPTSDQIDEIISNTIDSTNLIIVDPNPDKRTITFKKLSKLKGAKEFRLLKGPELVKWAIEEAGKHQSQLTQQNANYLLDVSGQDQWVLSNEIAKLANYQSDITKSTIDKLATPSLENNTFILTEALVKGDLKRVIELYKNLNIMGYADQMILGAIIYQYRSLLLAVLNDAELDRAYKMSPFSQNKARALVKDMGIEDIKRDYKIIAEADLAIKTGDLPSEEAMNKLFYSLCR